MNVGEGHNAFSDIPGFDATKGERIVKALQRLWAKIEQLEQIRISERKIRSKEVQTSAKEEELTITDVQYKLLVLQLQYARSIIRKKFNGIGDTAIAGTSRQTVCQPPGNENNIKIGCHMQQSVFPTVSQETQTGNSLIDGTNQNYFEKDTEISSSQVSYGTQYQPEDDKQTAFSSGRTIFPTSKPHYHLKLDDVPFILGASSTASHSVVANVQNIIAMMKSHNKALCGPRHNPKAPSFKSHPTVGNADDTSKMLNKLSQDLHELAQKQEKLVQRLDTAQKNSNASIGSEWEDVDKNRERTMSSRGHKRICTNSGLSKIQADVNVPKLRGKEDCGQRLAVKNQSGNLSIMDRRKLLKSLQNFKSHLSEEDISWE